MWTLNPDVDSVFLQFAGPTLTAPPVSPVAGTMLTLTAPFTLVNGRVMRINQFGQIEFLADLTGQGTLALQLQAFHSPDIRYWQYTGVSYRFSDETAPVPEPASLLLVAAGLAGVVRRRIQRTST